jgi:hypothetical protein
MTPKPSGERVKEEVARSRAEARPLQSAEGEPKRASAERKRQQGCRTPKPEKARFRKRPLQER